MRNTVVLVGCILLGTAFLAGLGAWQLKRLAWKEGLIARVEAGLQKPPVTTAQIEQDLSAGRDIEYRPAKAQGVFLHEREAHLFNTHKGIAGYFIYTPLRLDDGRLLFVNRGFATMDRKAPAARAEGQVAGRVEISGLARSAPAQKSNRFVPDNDLAANVYHWKSLAQMASRSSRGNDDDFLPFFLDADEAQVPGGWPVGGVTLVRFPNNHLQYAVTWFGLALTLVGVGAAFLWSRRKQPASGEAS